MFYPLRSETQQNPLIRKHLCGLQLMGWIVFEHQQHHYWHFIRGMFFSFTFFLFNITQHMDLVTLFGNIEEMTINAATTLLFTTTVSRFYDFYTHRREFVELINELDFNVRKMLNSDQPKERPIIDSHISYVNNLTISFWTCALVTANSMCVNTLIEWLNFPVAPEEGVQIPTILRSWLPVSPSCDNFYMFYFVHLYVMWVGMLIVPCWHAFIAALMIYIILELKLLQNRLTNFVDFLPAQPTAEEVYAFLSDCVEKQISLKDYVNKLLRLIKRSIFLDFIIYSALICALLYHASFTSSSVVVFITICFILTMSMILWLYHWHANLISVNSEELGMALYLSDWHLLNLRCRKFVLQFLVYSNLPWKLKSGFVTMNINTFLAIIRASYSYFTLLNQMAN